MKTGLQGWKKTVLAATLLAGIILQPAHAQQWQNIGLPEQNISSVAATPTALIAASLQGIYRSSNGGSTWDRTLPVQMSFSYWTIATGSTNAVYAVNGIELFARSSDNGVTWTTMEQDEILANFGVIKSLGVDNDNTAYLGTTSRFYRSQNQGESWDNISQGLPPNYPDVGKFAVMPSGTILAGTSGIVGGHIFKSGNRGSQWTRIYRGVLNEDITALTATQGAILAGIYGKGLMRSINEGQTWTATTIGNLTTPTINKLVAGGGNVYALIAGTVYHSTDDGQTWSEITAPQPQINTIAVAADGTLYAATTEGIYRFSTTTDVGEQSSATSLTVAPLPANTEAMCTFSLPAPALVQCTLANMNGKIVQTNTGTHYPAGIHTLSLYTADLPPGLYLLRLDAGNTTSMYPIIIHH